MKLIFRSILIFLILNIFSLPTNACLWDYDTIEMEQQKFPSVLELVAGKFLRHSPEFYYWRIKHRRSKLQAYPDSLSLYDDLAVAYSKIGEHQKAIALMQQKEAIQPAQYTTLSNMGTFYIFKGQLDSALHYIDQALAINPNAHFGREIYQKYLIEYLLSKSNNGKITFPLDATFYDFPEAYFGRVNQNNFYAFLKQKYALNQKTTIKALPEAALSKAIIGVMGMMKFADYDAPILLEILGDLLFNTGNKVAARHLASRAYLHASYQVEDKKSKETYRKRVAFLLANQYANARKEFIDIEKLEKIFAKELEAGKRFYEQICFDEMDWIKANEDVEAKFAQKYYQEPTLIAAPVRGTKRIHSDRREYINNKQIGTQLDYRPINIYVLDTVQMDAKQLIDSLYETSLTLEITADSIESIQEVNESQEETQSKDSNLLMILASIVAGLLVLLFAARLKSNK